MALVNYWIVVSRVGKAHSIGKNETCQEHVGHILLRLNWTNMNSELSLAAIQTNMTFFVAVSYQCEHPLRHINLSLVLKLFTFGMILFSYRTQEYFFKKKLFSNRLTRVDLGKSFTFVERRDWQSIHIVNWCKF